MVDRLRLAIRGDLKKFTEAAEQALPQAITGVVRRKTLGLKKSLRRQIQRAGLGTRLGFALRSQLTPPRGVALDAEGRLFSKAIVKRPGGSFDLLQVFQHGVTIRAASGEYLAIPAQSLLHKRRRIRPEDVRGELVFIAHGQPRLVMKDNPNVVVFWLVRTVRLRKRLRINETTERFTKNTGEQIARDLERRLNRLERRFST